VVLSPGRTVRGAGGVATTAKVHSGSAVTIGPVACPVESPPVAVTGAVTVAAQFAVTAESRLTGTDTVTAPIAGTVTPVQRTAVAVLVQVPPSVVVTAPTV
jgi:hypothetical protein